MLDPDFVPFKVMSRDFCSSNGLVFNYEETMLIREEYRLTHNNQILKKTRGKNGIDVVVERGSESESAEYNLVNIRVMFEYKDTYLALVKDGRLLELDERKRLFMNLSVTTEVEIWKLIDLKSVVGYAIKLPSLTS